AWAEHNQPEQGREAPVVVNPGGLGVRQITGDLPARGFPSHYATTSLGPVVRGARSPTTGGQPRLAEGDNGPWLVTPTPAPAKATTVSPIGDLDDAAERIRAGHGV